MSARPIRAPVVCEPPGVYRPRRPERSAFYRLVDDHYATFAFVHDDRFAREDGPLRPVDEQFLDCGRLENGFARVRGPKCAAEWSWVRRPELSGCLVVGSRGPRPKTRETVLRLDPMEWLRRVTNQDAEGETGHRTVFPTRACTRRDTTGPTRTAATGSTGRRTAESRSAPSPRRTAPRRATRARARLLRKAFEVDPLTCQRCGAERKVIAVNTAPAIADRMLRHLERNADADDFDERAPPAA